MTTTKTKTPYGHAPAAAENTCTCGREFTRSSALTQHVNHAYRSWAKAEKEAEDRAAASIATVIDADVKTLMTMPLAAPPKDYREHLTFEDGPLWDAIYHTLGLSGLVNLVTIEASLDNGVVTNTLHTKEEPGAWDMPEYEVWAFFRSVANGDLLDIDSLSGRFAGTAVGLHIVTVMMFLFLDPRKAHK